MSIGLMRCVRSRTWKWLVGTAVLVAVAIGVLRKVGLPMPEVILSYTIQGRMQKVAGNFFGWRLTLRFSNGQPKAQLLYRGTGEKCRLVSGEFFDREGNLRSRITDGNGVALLFHDSGKLVELVGYCNGVECEPHLRWSPEGKLVNAPGY